MEVENYPKWKDTIGETHFSLNHDYGRKSNWMKVPAGSLNLAEHIGFIGAHPTISPYEGMVHPIALYHRGGDLYPVSLQYQVDRGAGPKWPGDGCFRGWCLGLIFWGESYFVCIFVWSLIWWLTPYISNCFMLGVCLAGFFGKYDQFIHVQDTLLWK